MQVVGRTRTQAGVGIGQSIKSASGYSKTAALAAALILLPAVSSSPAVAQVANVDQACIAAFNKALRKVSKTHGKIVKKCTARFAAGSLGGQTPEACLAGESNGKLLSTITKEAGKIGYHCTFGMPSFGVNEDPASLSRAILTQFGLMHGTIGPNLDNNLIAIPDAARCQAKVTSALLKCEDARQKEYLKCQKTGLRNGAITDSSTLADQCLGTALSQQPDDRGRIASKCDKKLLVTLVKQCDGTDLSQAFASCGSTNPSATAACLSSESACQLCRMLNDAGGVLRDCDAFDDGDDSNGSCNAECGDGVVHPEESCDDQNLSSGDGCSDLCLEEFGYTCTGEPSVCTPNCGNGTIDVGEVCDDGDTDAGDGCSGLLHRRERFYLHRRAERSVSRVAATATSRSARARFATTTTQPAVMGVRARAKSSRATSARGTRASAPSFAAMAYSTRVKPVTTAMPTLVTDAARCARSRPAGCVPVCRVSARRCVAMGSCAASRDATTAI